METKKIHLSVVIPAYNEEKRIPKTLTEISDYLKQQSYEWEIIVVSDGSSDRTVDIARSFSNQIKNLEVIAMPERQGKGFGVRQGMLKAKGKYRIFTDADNSTPIQEVEKFWPEFDNGYEVVIGSRDIEGADVAVPQPFFRRFLGNGFNLLVQILLGLWGVWDTQCGFKGFSSKAAEEIFSISEIKHFGFDPEILAIAKKRGYKIKEVPIRWLNDADSKVKMSHTIKMFKEVLITRRNLWLGKYDKK
ncbi:MAG: glycosyltransferase family 2 protein [Candidatus Pacebacteria bacterium]|jgi:dolichyl-phosphate beta-glucosyltransferase|nr:glycosyltransferase family 2 protein [Candidatus Paceibacterota bacterium]MDD4874986.1 glycosyltransferase family 2 protein [Candidatus Paceibacterota bacterium]